MKRLEIRGMEPDLLRGYLASELGGRQTTDGSVAGDGWHARFVQGAPIRMALVLTQVLFVEFEGERAEEAAAFLARKAMRGGG